MRYLDADRRKRGGVRIKVRDAHGLRPIFLFEIYRYVVSGPTDAALG